MPLKLPRNLGPWGRIGGSGRWGFLLCLGGCLATIDPADQEALERGPWLPLAGQVALADTPETPFSWVPETPTPRPKPPNPVNTSIIRLSSGTPEELIGLGPEVTMNLLGAPSTRVEEASTRIWQYDDDACTLQLTLLLNVLTSTYQTVFYEVTPADGAEITREACLSTIIAKRAAAIPVR